MAWSRRRRIASRCRTSARHFRNRSESGDTPVARFKSGVLGWLDEKGGGSDCSRSVTEIAFSPKEVGEVSDVIVRPDGVFLVRWMALRPAVQTPFENVRSSLEREKQARLRKQVEAGFIQEIEARNPLQ